MNPPKEFVRSLESQFGGKLRVRWSWQNSEWQIEEKVGRPIPPSRFIEENDDRGIRFRDGYALMMRIRTGDRVGCPRCKEEVKISVGEVKESKCKNCGQRIMAYYFPLSDSLLEYLRKTDPNRGGYERLKRDLLEEMDPIGKERKRILDDSIAFAREDFSQIVGNPVIGYSGKERYQ